MTNTTRKPESSSSGLARNALCPCGSGKKYKRCCGSLAGQIELLPELQTAQEHFQRGIQLLRSGQTSAAMPVLLEAMQLDPNHFEAHHALGSALLQSGRIANATAILSRAVGLRP